MQTLPPFEHWIIDGSSNEEIKNWLEGQKQPPFRKWINERDKGIADAFNKGVSRSTGDVVYLLNSGDRLFDETVLEKVTAAFEKKPSMMWLHGKLKTLRGNEWVVVGKPFEKEKLYRGMRGVFHPTMFIRKEVYQRNGTYDSTIKMAMDYDMLCRMADEPSGFLDYPVAIFDPTGISSVRYLDAMHESFACYRKYFGNSVKQKLWGTRLTLLHNLLNTNAGKWLYKLKVKMGLENV
jgi:glycosyltransferase involved in cell wall biosynthesis